MTRHTQAVQITFNMAIELGASVLGASGTYQLCESLFTQASINLMQTPAPATPTTDAYCTLDSTSTILDFYPGSGATLNTTQHILELLPSTVFRAGSGDAPNAAYVPTPLAVSLGPHPQAPTAVVSVSTTVSYCSAVLIDGSGSLGGLGRALLYLWQLDGATQFGGYSTQSMITAAAGSLAVGSHTVTLTVQNAFALTATTVAAFTVTAAAVPTVTIAGPTATTPAATVLLAPTVTPAPCAVAISYVYRYLWTQLAGPSVLGGVCCASQVRQRNMNIPAGTLAPAFYSFQV